MIKFYAYGHENILAEHKTTLEFTKDKSLTTKGDCIIGINSNFDLNSIKDFIDKVNNKIKNINIKENNERKIKNNYKNYKIKIILKININNKNKIINKKDGINKNLKNNLIKKEIINCEINKNFNSNREMVIRKSGFTDKRTFAIKADKAACDIDREVINTLKNPNSTLQVLITA